MSPKKELDLSIGLPLEANFVSCQSALHAPPGRFYQSDRSKTCIKYNEWWLTCKVKNARASNKDQQEAIEAIMEEAIHKMATLAGFCDYFLWDMHNS